MQRRGCLLAWVERYWTHKNALPAHRVAPPTTRDCRDAQTNSMHVKKSQRGKLPPPSNCNFLCSRVNARPAPFHKFHYILTCLSSHHLPPHPPNKPTLSQNFDTAVASVQVLSVHCGVVPGEVPAVESGQGVGSQSAGNRGGLWRPGWQETCRGAGVLQYILRGDSDAILALASCTN